MGSYDSKKKYLNFVFTKLHYRDMPAYLSQPNLCLGSFGLTGLDSDLPGVLFNETAELQNKNPNKKQKRI